MQSMDTFNWTEEEKRPYWHEAERRLKRAGIRAEIDYAGFGINPEHAIVYLKPVGRGRQTINMWADLKKVEGFESYQVKIKGKPITSRLHGRILVRWGDVKKSRGRRGQKKVQAV